MMHAFINSPWQIKTLKLPNRLIQGPLAGYSCAPFRALFSQFTSPAYCVSEMISAWDILHKHRPDSRYLYRAPEEAILAYQISGNDKAVLADAALYLQHFGADIIDLNCGCPKTKIRKKGAGSALLETPDLLADIVTYLSSKLRIPLTVKIRIQGNANDLMLAQKLADCGADALIVHGRRWIDDYDVACNLQQIALIKKHCSIPVIANGDISQRADLIRTVEQTGCDAYMISRSGSGRPWLFQELLGHKDIEISPQQRLKLFMHHLSELAQLEDEYKAVLQSKSLVRYYFRSLRTSKHLTQFYQCSCLKSIHCYLESLLPEFSHTPYIK